MQFNSKLASDVIQIETTSCCIHAPSAESRLRGARGIYYPRGPGFAADLQHLPRQRVQDKQWGGGRSIK